MAHDEPPHLGLHYLASLSLNSSYDIALMKHFLNFADINFVVSSFAKLLIETNSYTLLWTGMEHINDCSQNRLVLIV